MDRPAELKYGAGVSPIALATTALLLGAGLGAGGALVMLRRAARGRSRLDMPGERRLHAAPTPRGGGIGIVGAGIVAAGLAFATAEPTRSMILVIALLWALPNGVMGVWDDAHPMRHRTKLAIQFAAATASAMSGLAVDRIAVPVWGELVLGPASVPFTVLWLVWMANAFNFMDGLDALAAGCAIIFCVAFGAMALGGDAPAFALLPAALLGGMAGFLRFNRPPARIFMGDGGSLYAGATLGGMAVVLTHPSAGDVPFIACLLALGSFLWDTTYTLVWRTFAGVAHKPHTTHLFQRLVLAGWTHTRVRVLFYGLSVTSGIAAIAYPHLTSVVQTGILLGAAAVAVSLVVGTRRAERSLRR